MTTSGVITGLDTAGQLITDALIELGVYSSNQTLKASDGELGRRRLNWMLKEWQDDGCNLWRQQTIDITWPAATAEGDLTGVNEIFALRVINSPTSERVLTRWELADYNDFPNKATVGEPSVYAMTRELAGARLRLWPVSANALALKATADRRIEDVTSLTETVDVPQQYTRTVMMNLASALAPSFGRATDQNAVVVIREAARLYQIMRANDRPSSYFMQSDGGAYGYQ